MYTCGKTKTDWTEFLFSTKNYFNFFLVKFMFIYVSIYLYMSVIITISLILLFQIKVCHTKLLFILKECMNASIYKKHITNTTNTCSLTSYNVNATKIMCFFFFFCKMRQNRKLIENWYRQFRLQYLVYSYLLLKTFLFLFSYFVFFKLWYICLILSKIFTM